MANIQSKEQLRQIYQRVDDGNKKFIPAKPKADLYGEGHIYRVCAYCRVSTDKEDQANSFETQQRYFREWIDRNPEWMLQEIYADEGISGTNTKKREGFRRMIQDALSGKIDLIVTKSVSRFARNTVDSLTTVRKLKEKGVGFFFARKITVIMIEYFVV